MPALAVGEVSKCSSYLVTKTSAFHHSNFVNTLGGCSVRGEIQTPQPNHTDRAISSQVTFPGTNVIWIYWPYFAQIEF